MHTHTASTHTPVKCMSDVVCGGCVAPTARTSRGYGTRTSRGTQHAQARRKRQGIQAVRLETSTWWWHAHTHRLFEDAARGHVQLCEYWVGSSGSMRLRCCLCLCVAQTRHPRTVSTPLLNSVVAQALPHSPHNRGLVSVSDIGVTIHGLVCTRQPFHHPHPYKVTKSLHHPSPQ